MKVFQELMSYFSVSETKRQYRSLRISAEHNTSVRFTDEVMLLKWIPHFAVQFLNKRRTGRRWRKPAVQFGQEIWFRKIGEEGITSSVKRRIQGIFVGHPDRTRAIPYRTRQTLSDAREPMNLEDWFGDLGHMVIRSHVMITETILAADDLPRIVAENTR